jgi:uncharacterized protein YceK
MKKGFCVGTAIWLIVNLTTSMITYRTLISMSLLQWSMLWKLKFEIGVIKEYNHALSAKMPLCNPDRIIVESITFIATLLNAFPSQNGHSEIYIPCSILTNTSLDWKYHALSLLDLPFKFMLTGIHITPCRHVWLMLSARFPLAVCNVALQLLYHGYNGENNFSMICGIAHA